MSQKNQMSQRTLKTLRMILLKRLRVQMIQQKRRDTVGRGTEAETLTKELPTTEIQVMEPRVPLEFKWNCFKT